MKREGAECLVRLSESERRYRRKIRTGHARIANFTKSRSPLLSLARFGPLKIRRNSETLLFAILCYADNANAQLSRYDLSCGNFELPVDSIAKVASCEPSSFPMN